MSTWCTSSGKATALGSRTAWLRLLVNTVELVIASSSCISNWDIHSSALVLLQGRRSGWRQDRKSAKTPAAPAAQNSSAHCLLPTMERRCWQPGGLDLPYLRFCLYDYSSHIGKVPIMREIQLRDARCRPECGWNLVWRNLR